ncbi:MAG: YidC/Oxa1 family insertase periplasmic-domain containing protein [Fibromonadaceae bacterium]|jgi:YidC/Oxa1 family membrane protein insertase|nr:YidC/Oxa1 family insertase periplasmic-domain containing protein [Fibromonadaceae bacterium]
MSKNTAIGIVLIVLLFIWSMQNATKQQELAQSEMQRKATELALEKAKQDSLAGIKSPKMELGSPELSLPSEPAIEKLAGTEDNSPFTAQDSSMAILDADEEEVIKYVGPNEILVETERFFITLNSKGAKITSIVPKTLADSSGSFPELLQNKETGALSVSFDNADFSNVVFSVVSPNNVVVKDSAKVAFEWKDEMGRTVTREYKFTKDSHSIRHVTRIKGFVPRLYTLNWKGGMRETEEIPVVKSFGMSYLFSEVIFNNTYNVERETVEKQKWFNREQGRALWFGLRRKYIAAVINFDSESEASLGAEPIKEKRNEKDPGTYALTISDNMATDSIAFNFTILPLQWKEIKEMGQGYEKIIVSGWEWMGADKWFVWLCGLLLHILNAFYALIPNYGVAIILLTILVKVVTTPLALKQLRSTRSMMALKPELDAIRAKNRGDMRAQQQEIMALYARHGVSPFSGLAGCLPMLLQMPIFIGLFVVLGRAIELREAPFIAWISDLSKADVIWRGISVPYIMPEGVGILPFLMVVSTWYQTKQTITDPNQKMMVWMMPAMMFVFSSVMPSGLVLYWTISNLWGIAQFIVINRKPATTSKNAPKGKIVEAKIVKKK